MKLKTTRICAKKGCGKEFRMYRTTDKYCSPSCAYDAIKKKGVRYKPIPQRNTKSRKLLSQYKKKRDNFMSMEENQICPVAMYFLNKKNLPESERIFWSKNTQTQECHHKAGRIGFLLLYTPLFLAVSSAGHKWIHDNPKQSYNLGFMVKRTAIDFKNHKLK